MEQLVEKVLNAKNFTECLGYWQQCRLEDAVLYEIAERMKFKGQKDDGIAIELDNLTHTLLYSEEGTKHYLRHAFTDFIKHRLTPKREGLKKKLMQKALGSSALTIVIGSAVISASFIAPQAYLPHILLGSAGALGLAYLNMQHNRKKSRKEMEAGVMIAVKDIELFKSIKDIEGHKFFEDNKAYFRQKLDEYWNARFAADKKNSS